MTLTIGSIGENLDLTIKQGASFGPFTFNMQNPDATPVDLTGVTFAAKIKKLPTTPVVATLLIEVTDAANGQYQMSLTAVDTAKIPAGTTIDASQSGYLWDMEMTDSLGRVTPLYYGAARVFREIT